MTDLLLENLDVKNFRTFEHLQIERLGRVNLITGKNNVGKSSLLEALWLYARGGTADAIRDLLIYRDEVATQQLLSQRGRPVLSQIPTSDDETLESVKYLFHDYRITSVPPPPVYVGPIEVPHKRVTARAKRSVRIEVDWYIVQEAEDEDTPRRFVKVDAQKRLQFEDAALYFVVTSHAGRMRFKLDRIFNRLGTPSSINEFPLQFVKTDGLSAKDVSALWDDIQLTDAEEAVLEAVRLIVPGIERVSVRGEQAEQRKPIPIVRVKGQDEPIPLRVFGDGLSRLFGLTLALVNAKGGLLLVDEIENGIHYSVFPHLWHFIFQAATRFNVQVFATTHSLDCVRSFQKAAKESPEDGILVRLKERRGVVAAILLTEDELGLATRDDVEVR